MSSIVELVKDHPWKLAAAASIPIIGAAVPLYLHIKGADIPLDDDRENINKTRNITAGVQVLGCGALAAGAYLALKVGLAVLLKVSTLVLIGYLSLASCFILPAAILLIYLLYSAFPCDDDDSMSQSSVNNQSDISVSIRNPNFDEISNSTIIEGPVVFEAGNGED